MQNESQDRNSGKRVFHNNEDCPVRNVVAQIGDMWTLLILFTLVDDSERFNTLKFRVEGISQRMFTQTLIDLEREGYISRTVYPEVPVRVEYVLIKLGKGIVKPSYELVLWADKHQSTFERARKTYDKHKK